MTTFPWDPNFATGLEDVDGQHHHLVDVINAFSSLLEQEAEPDPSTLGPVYADLAEYARYHFRTEEELMAAVRLDPRHALQHQREHQDFGRQVQEMVAHPAGTASEKAHRLLDFLVHWLTWHILGSDQSMARQVKAIRAGRDPATAFADNERAVDPATATLLRSVQALFELLTDRNKELTALTATLEARVQERTQALSVANGELKALVERVEQMAMTDILTGLPNRRYALDRLGRAWALSARHGQPLSVLVIDADGFKQVNDVHGHEAGDVVLRALAAALRRAARSCDDVCRLGGDEFVVIAPETPLAGGLCLGERLRAAVAELRVPAGAGVWRGSISVGVASRRADVPDVQALLRAADQGVYAAKRAGRNTVRAADEEASGAEVVPAARAAPPVH